MAAGDEAIADSNDAKEMVSYTAANSSKLEDSAYYIEYINKLTILVLGYSHSSPSK